MTHRIAHIVALLRGHYIDGHIVGIYPDHVRVYDNATCEPFTIRTIDEARAWLGY